LAAATNPLRVVLLAAALLFLSAAPAHAAFGRCPSDVPAPISCETVTVPLDRGGAVPGTVNLFVERVPGTAPVHGALIVLAGGPGQAATPLTTQIAPLVAPALKGRDLIVFDQRGAGRSDPIDCPSLDGPAITTGAVTACAIHLGPRRGLYTSRDTADDIEAIRHTLGLDKVSVFGVSYGTYTALTYARRYPAHVESLVLDSTIAPDGRDPFERSMFAAIRRVVASLCAGDCRGITHRPLGDLRRLVARARRHPFTAEGFGGRGRRKRIRVTADTLLGLVVGSDQDPTVQAELPAVTAAATRGDTAPLARLLQREQGGGDSAGGGSAAALFFATGCEELPLPWSRTAPLSARPRADRRAIDRIAAAAFAPWARATELRTGVGAACIGWPDASAQSPAVGGSAPDVPVLELEGANDIRTPVADARAVAALFPHATLVVVPHTGHSVLGTDLSGCASTALAQFFAGQAVAQCGRTRNPFPPVHLPPTHLGRVSAGFIGGLPGRTLTAVEDTLDDATQQAVDYSLFTNRIAAGGLRGGFMRMAVTSSELRLQLHRFESVPGVVVTGTARLVLAAGLPHFAHVTVTGSGAHGTLTFSDQALTGHLGRRRIHLVAAAGIDTARLEAILRLARRPRL
jgi:pimeloyl-ACP methyl ester carboxylesterase